MECSMKRFIRYIIGTAVLAVLLQVQGCQKPFTMDVPLGVSRPEFYAPADGGRYNVVIFAKGEWTASLERNVSWCTVERVDNGTISGLYINVAENKSMSRGVNVVVSSGEYSQKIYVAQMSGMGSPMISFDTPVLYALKPVKTLKVHASSNLDDETLSTAKVDVRYSEGSEAWIRDFRMEGQDAVFTIEENNTGAERSAVVVVEIPGAYEDLGASSQIFVHQTHEPAKVNFIQDVYNADGLAENLVLPINANFEPSVYPEYTVTYGFCDEKGAAVDWIRNVTLTVDALKGRTRINNTAPRSATAYIEVKEGNNLVSRTEMTVNQAVSTADVVDGDDSDEQTKDPEEEF